MNFQTFCLSATLAVFSITTAAPREIYFESSLTENLYDEAQLTIRLQSLLDNLTSLDDVGEMIHLMLQFKYEVESLTGEPISMDDALEEIQRELREEGHEIPEDEMANFKELIHQQMAPVSAPRLPAPDSSDITLNINKGGSETNTQVLIPTQVALGVTIALCGSIVFFLPVPSSKVWGEKLVKAGIDMAVEGGASSLNHL